MRVLIVDDEAPARARLKRLLAAIDGIEVVAEAADGEQALLAVALHAPDVLLLDIQMPGLSGLDVAASLPAPAPRVVFVTAYDQYALPAFEAAALDYLLKPVDPERLARSVQRWGQPATQAPNPPPQRLLIPDRGRTHVIECDAIVRLASADNYVEIHADGHGALLMRRPLAALLADLGPAFARTHRGHAVALARLQRIEVRERGAALARLAGGAAVPVSRQYRAALLRQLTRR